MTDAAGYMLTDYDNLLSQLVARMTLDYTSPSRGTRADGIKPMTSRVFGQQLRFDLSSKYGPSGRIPVVTRKKLHWRSVVAELLWFLRGDTNIRSLQADGCHIWDAWADENGNLGPIYGAQWRGDRMGRPDQVGNIIDAIRAGDLYNRGYIVSAWQNTDLPRMALRPCHTLWQVLVEDSMERSTFKQISLVLTQRSADVFLGLPFNIASYALLLHILAAATGTEPKELIINIGDAHLYDNQLAAARQYLKEPARICPHLVPSRHALAALAADGKDALSTLAVSDFLLHGYSHGPALSVPVVV